MDLVTVEKKLKQHIFLTPKEAPLYYLRPTTERLPYDPWEYLREFEQYSQKIGTISKMGRESDPLDTLELMGVVSKHWNKHVNANYLSGKTIISFDEVEERFYEEIIAPLLPKNHICITREGTLPNEDGGEILFVSRNFKKDVDGYQDSITEIDRLSHGKDVSNLTLTLIAESYPEDDDSRSFENILHEDLFEGKSCPFKKLQIL